MQKSNLTAFAPFTINAEEVVGGRRRRRRRRRRNMEVEPIPEVIIIEDQPVPIPEYPEGGIPLEDDPLCTYHPELGIYSCS